MKRKALGKGLSALLPDPETAAPGPAETATVALALLDPNPYQPRQQLSPARLEELAASIRQSGVVQPILVRPRGERYQIIAGERRYRAARLAGLTEVPVAVRDVDGPELLQLALVENVQREDLGPLEEAQAYQRLHEELGLSQEDVARRVGKDRSTVANTMRLLRLPREVRDLVAAGGLDAGHGRALLALDRAEDQIAVAREAAQRGLSVREVERRVSLLRAPHPAGRERRRDPNTRAAEQNLRAALGTRVEIRRRGRGGQIAIAFASEAELNRLYEHLLRGGRARG
jgi:ParB family chromosome partitioning protein